MRNVLGCSGLVALVVFLLGFAASLFVGDAPWSVRLAMAGTQAVITSAAFLALSLRDWVAWSSTMRSVRKGLLAASDISENEFLSSRPCENIVLLLETRDAISRFFGVPAGRIDRDVQLIRDLHVDKMEPSFHFFVVSSVVASRQCELRSFGFSMAGIETIDELADAVGKVLDGFATKRGP